jgi:hypothetical protein
MTKFGKITPRKQLGHVRRLRHAQHLVTVISSTSSRYTSPKVTLLTQAAAFGLIIAVEKQETVYQYPVDRSPHLEQGEDGEETSAKTNGRLHNRSSTGVGCWHG